MKKLITLIISIFLPFGCKEDTKMLQIEDGLIPFTTAQKLLADKLVSCFENDNPIIQYGYIENLNDGRGYTAGKAGFTTANGDLLEVIEKYTELKPGNTLEVFIPTLKTISQNNDSNIINLTELPSKWLENSSDAKFIEAQNYVSDINYYQPSVEACNENGLKLPISLMSLYDCTIQHGAGTDPDGLYAIIERTNTEIGGSPKDGKNELNWIIKFNQIRKTVLMNPTNSETKEVWQESVGRVDALLKLIEIDKNYKFDQPTIQINPYGTIHILTL